MFRKVYALWAMAISIILMGHGSLPAREGFLFGPPEEVPYSDRFSGNNQLIALDLDGVPVIFLESREDGVGQSMQVLWKGPEGWRSLLIFTEALGVNLGDFDVLVSEGRFFLVIGIVTDQNLNGVVRILSSPGPEGPWVEEASFPSSPAYRVALAASDGGVWAIHILQQGAAILEKAEGGWKKVADGLCRTYDLRPTGRSFQDGPQFLLAGQWGTDGLVSSGTSGWNCKAQQLGFYPKLGSWNGRPVTVGKISSTTGLQFHFQGVDGQWAVETITGMPTDLFDFEEIDGLPLVVFNRGPFIWVAARTEQGWRRDQLPWDLSATINGIDLFQLNGSPAIVTQDSFSGVLNLLRAVGGWGATDCDLDGLPDDPGSERDPDCNGNGIPDACDLQSPIDFGWDTFDAGYSGSRPLIADFDGDHHPDVAVIGYQWGTISILHNAGDGKLHPPVDILMPGAWGMGISCVIAADLDGDGSPDLAATSGDLLTYFNDGRGNFGDPDRYSFGSPVHRLAAADFNGDGRIDLAASLQYLTNNQKMVILLNQGNGVFNQIDAPSYTLQGSPSTHFAADLDGDGDQDLAGWDLKTNGIGLLRNNGNGVFTPSGQVMVGGEHPLALTLNDWDGDGKGDLAVIPDFPDVVILLRNQTPPPSATDYNRNGSPDPCDIASGLSRDRKGGVANGIPDECEPPTSFHRGDSNGDGAIDVSDGQCLLESLFLGGGCLQGAGGGPAPGCLAAADANADGTVDCTDPVYVLQWLFLGGEPPLLPGPPSMPCGPDPDPAGPAGSLGCESYPPCE